MVGIELSIRIEPGNRREFLQAFGVLSCKKDKRVDRFLYENAFESAEFLWVERWSDAMALDAYMASDAYRSLLGAVEVLGELEKCHVVEYKAMPIQGG